MVTWKIGMTRRPHLQPLGNPLHRPASVLTIGIFIPFHAPDGDVRPTAHAQFVGDPFQAHRGFPAQTRRPEHLARIPFALQGQIRRRPTRRRIPVFSMEQSRFQILRDCFKIQNG